MSYKYKDVPKKTKVIWVRLIKPYEGMGKYNFPSSLNVGDITWLTNDYLIDGELYRYLHIENNRYCENFERSYFELVSVGELVTEPQYEIY